MFSSVDAHLRATGRTLVEVVPQLRAPLMSARGAYARSYVRARMLRHDLLHSASIDPYRVAWIDPDRIERVSKKFYAPKFRRVGAIADGDWDRSPLRFEETDVYRAFDEHFNDGRPWEDTEFFHRVLGEIQSGLTRWECSSRADLERRCSRLDDLYESIEEHGFRSQRQLLESSLDDPIGKRRYSLTERLLNDEIAVNVARNGELLFADGRNRLSIAKVLGLDEVPVLFLVRHEKWQRFRDRVADHAEETDTVPSLLDCHPDLADIGSHS